MVERRTLGYRVGVLSVLARALLMATVIVLGLLSASEARAQKKTLSGRWSATAMRVVWRVGDWGKKCGPKPGGGGAPAGTVQITQKGGELSMTGAGRSYSTARCWETLPGMSVSHTGGSRGWRSVCRTRAGDPRQATITTTISATDDTISFDETGQYQFVVKGQNCTASVRRNRSFRIIQREGEKPPEPKEEPPPAVEPPKPKPEPRRPKVDCTDVGPPARLEVRPSKKLMRPGEEFSFRTLILDAKGCSVTGKAAAWEIATEGAQAELVKPGQLKVPDNASDAEIELTVSVAGKSVTVSVQIAGKERYDALLAQGGFNEAGERDEAAVAVIAGGSVGAKSAVAEDKAKARKTTFLAVVGSVAVALGLAGLVMVARGRKKKKEQESGSAGEVGAPRSVRRGHDAMVCPTCRSEYPPGSQFCPADGNRLVVYEEEDADGRGPAGGICPVCNQGFDPGVNKCPEHGEELIPAAAYFDAQEVAKQKMICPLCGKMYEGGESKFCGEDGGALVPVN